MHAANCILTMAVMAGLLAGLPALAAELPAPLLALDFEEGARNTGTLGGEARIEEFAPGEAPYFGEGLGGIGLRLDAASRSGGTTNEPAGGAVLFSHPTLDAARQITLAGWFQSESSGVNTRLFYKRDAWDVAFGGRILGIQVVSGGKKQSYPVEAGRPPWGEGWEFVAVVLDGGAGVLRTYSGQGATGEFARTGEAKGVPPPDAAESPVEIGNLGGIRPFKGGVDRIRVYAAALDDAQVEALFREGLRGRRTLRDGLGALPPLRAQGPKLSDVCFSTRWKRPNALDAIKAFGATRCEWVYGADAEFVKGIKAAGATYGGTINCNPKVPNNEGAARDFDGKPLVAPWMSSWGAIYVTSTHPNTRDALTTWAKQCIDLGADALHTDDCGLEAASVGWGGDFEETTLRGFGDYLRANVPATQLAEWGIAETANFNYRDYLKRKYAFEDNAAYRAKLNSLPTTPVWQAYLRHTARAHYIEMRKLLDAYGGRRTPLSMNMGSVTPQADRIFLSDFCDYLLCETNTADFGRDALTCATSRALGLTYVATMFPRSVAETRAKIAGFYALGTLPLVPWDIYMGSDATGSQPRYFGKPEEYGDLYAFVRANAGLFEGHEMAPVVGILAPTDRYRDTETHRVARMLAEAQVPFTFVLTGGKEIRFSPDLARVRRLRALVYVNPVAELTEEETTLLETAGVPVLVPDDLTARRLEELSPVVVHGPRGIHAVPRLSEGAGNRELAIHVVNTNIDRKVDAGLPQRHVSLTLRYPAQLGARLARAEWLQPGAEPRPLEWDQTMDGPRVLLPPVGVWGIVRAEFSDQ